MHTRPALFGLLFALAGSLATARASAQTTYPTVKVSGRLHAHFYYAEAGATTASDFFLRRARIQAGGQITERIGFLIQPSFEGGRTVSGNRGGVRLRDAYIDLRLTDPDARTSATVRMGQEKRPFSRYELTSSNNLPSVERGAGKGLPGSAANDLFGSAGFLAHDVGASLEVVAPLGEGRALTVKGGVYNGQGESVSDANTRKSFGGRVTVDVASRLSVGGSYFSHDAIVGADSAFTHDAWGVDAQWGAPGDRGLFLLGEYLQGERNVAGRDPMRGVSLVGAYHARLGGERPLVYAIEPVVRVDLADPNTDQDDDRATLITAGLGLYFSAKAQFRVVYERQTFQAPVVPSAGVVRSAMTVNF